MNPAPPTFESFEDAEKTMKDHVLSLCVNIQTPLSMYCQLKCIVEPKILDADKQIFNQLYDEETIIYTFNSAQN